MYAMNLPRQMKRSLHAKQQLDVPKEEIQSIAASPAESMSSERVCCGDEKNEKTSRSIRNEKAIRDSSQLARVAEENPGERLLRVCATGSIDAVRSLDSAAFGAAWTARTKQGASALHLACFGGHLEVAVWLHDACGLGLELRDKCGGRPMHVASFAGQTAIVKWLISRGALIDSEDDSRARPLHHAYVPGWSP